MPTAPSSGRYTHCVTQISLVSLCSAMALYCHHDAVHTLRDTHTHTSIGGKGCLFRNVKGTFFGMSEVHTLRDTHTHTHLYRKEGSSSACYGGTHTA
jgi:hypothetical protein